MKQFFLPYRKFFFLFSLFILVTWIVFYYTLKPRRTLPVYTPAMVNVELVDSLVQHENNKQTHIISSFSLINQNGTIITDKDYKDNIYVANFFFTTCPSICPIMTDNMVWLQERIRKFDNVKLLSFSVTPEIDTPEILKKYAKEKGVDDKIWNLVTGNKKEIYFLARRSYLAVKTGSLSEMYDMVHTENFILVDDSGRIRGFYDGTNLNEHISDTKNIEQLLDDIKWLVKKKKQNFN